MRLNKYGFYVHMIDFIEIIVGLSNIDTISQSCGDIGVAVFCKLLFFYMLWNMFFSFPFELDIESLIKFDIL